jgi:hypothetical protein
MNIDMVCSMLLNGATILASATDDLNGGSNVPNKLTDLCMEGSVFVTTGEPSIPGSVFASMKYIAALVVVESVMMVLEMMPLTCHSLKWKGAKVPYGQPST